MPFDWKFNADFKYAIRFSISRFWTFGPILNISNFIEIMCSTARIHRAEHNELCLEFVRSLVWPQHYSKVGKIYRRISSVAKRPLRVVDWLWKNYRVNSSVGFFFYKTYQLLYFSLDFDGVCFIRSGMWFTIKMNQLETNFIIIKGSHGLPKVHLTWNFWDRFGTLLII